MECHWIFFNKNWSFYQNYAIHSLYANPKERILNGIESANCMLQSLFAVADAKLLVFSSFLEKQLQNLGLKGQAKRNGDVLTRDKVEFV